MSTERAKLYLAMLTLCLGIVGFAAGIWQFLKESEANRRAAEERNEREFVRSLWRDQYETYRAISSAVGDLIAAIEYNDEALRREAVLRFTALYWGPAIIAEDDAVKDQMIRFRQLVLLNRDGLVTADQLKAYAKGLSDTLQRSTVCGERSFGPAVAPYLCDGAAP